MKNYKFIKSDKDWQNFIKKEKLFDRSAKPIRRAKVKGLIKFAFWFLRIYVIVMVVLIILGFLHLL